MKRKSLLFGLVLFVLTSCGKVSPRRSTSTSASTSSSSERPAPGPGFYFLPARLEIDLKNGSTGEIYVFNSYAGSESISWVIPKTSMISFEKVETRSNEQNTYHAFNTGSLTISATWRDKEVKCEINIVNTAVKKTSGTEKISIYAVNDYHGHVNETFSLKHYGTFIKQKVNQPNTLFLDQGDTWQGSLESNYNRGRMITDVYNAAGMSARTIGNHDFDWGIDALVENTAASYHGYSTPVLAANVYDFDWDSKIVGTTQQSQIGREYVTFTLDSGIKVGVVGAISDSCEPDICTPNIMSVEFVNIIKTIQEISDTLRIEEGCDLVIASMHEGYFNYMGTELSSISPLSHKKYVDLGLNGHTHQREYYEENGVTFAQFGNYDNYIGKINLTYDYVTGEISQTDVYTLDTTSLLDDVPTIDPEINKIVDHYNEQTDVIGKEVLTTQLQGEFDRYGAMPNLVCKAMYEEAIRQGYDVSYALCNMSRMVLEGPVVTYASLYETLPFDNLCYIVEMSGQDAYNEMNASGSLFIYRGDNEDARLPIDSSKEKYTFVVLDYIALHAGINREYDYIPSANPIAELKKNGISYNYREVTADYMRNQTGAINRSDYSSYNIRYDRGQTSQEMVIS